MRVRSARGFEMILLAAITLVESAGFFLAGAVVCFGILWWKDQNAKKLQSLQTQSILDHSRREAEAIVRDARLAASEEARKIREQTEQSFAAARQERADAERRQAERESLINTQLEKLVQVEKNLQDQKTAVLQQGESLAAKQLELSRLTQQRREQLQSLAHLSVSEARTQFLKEIEQEAMRDASELARHIADSAKARA